jgi:hypothetical protein
MRESHGSHPIFRAIAKGKDLEFFPNQQGTEFPDFRQLIAYNGLSHSGSLVSFHEPRDDQQISEEITSLCETVSSP